MEEKITAVQVKYIDDLMLKAHVVGVGVGLAKVEDEYTDELALVVLVDEKVPLEDLDEDDIIPEELEGVRVDVQETGVISSF
ncbi:MAG: hypothetical protein Phog2KO_36040 [Phototrophicaceae bacterium]